MMRIAIASGKGGTGKTTVATNLAWIAAKQGRRVAYLVCDVEEPNGHLFLKPQIRDSKPVARLVPKVWEQNCTYCDACGAICRFSAIVCIGKKVLVFPQLCHGCGGCAYACPEGAITEAPHEAGVLEMGHAGPVQFIHGILRIGEAMSTPVIRAVNAAAPEVDLVVIDAPPGTSCPVIESARGADYVLLVTEPTPFGLQDLKLAVEMVRALKLPHGVVINRVGIGNHDTWTYCSAEGIPVLAEIPDAREIAETCSAGELASVRSPMLRGVLDELLARLEAFAPTAAAP